MYSPIYTPQVTTKMKPARLGDTEKSNYTEPSSWKFKSHFFVYTCLAVKQ